MKRAVERELTIIGEAVNRILKEGKQIELKESKKIISSEIELFIHTMPLMIIWYGKSLFEIFHPLRKK